MELAKLSDLYPDFEYPYEFREIVRLNLLDFELWYLMDAKQVRMRICGLQNRYPLRKLIPFARRDDCDDIACFEIGSKNEVQIIHDFASAGYEQRTEYSRFWEWLRAAVDEMIERLDDEKMYL